MLTRPRSAVENPAGGGGNLFPEGTFLFTILTPTNERVRITPVDELPEFMTSDINQFNNEKQLPWFTGDREETNIWLGKAEPVDDSPDVGEQIFFQSFVTADGEHTINSLEAEPNGEGAKITFNNNLDLYFNLADALGATYDADDGVAVSDDFCDMLQAGDFDDQQIIATIEHRAKKRGKNKGQEYHVLTGFTAA